MVSRFSLMRRDARSSSSSSEEEVVTSTKRIKKKFPLFRRRTDENHVPSVTQQQTRVVPMTQQQRREDLKVQQEDVETYLDGNRFACAALPMCGMGRDTRLLIKDESETAVTEHEDPFRDFPEDPSVQESIECIVAATQGDLVDLLKQSDDDYLPTPSSLQQSLLKNRSFRRLPAQYPQRRISSRRALKPPDHLAVVSTTSSFEKLPAVASCGCCAGHPPVAPPEHWPQRPLLLRPTPDSGTSVVGVRFVGSQEYLWKAGESSNWADALAKHWGKPVSANPPSPYCSQCVLLPVNNGREPEGESLVTDFESPLFKGTLLLRIRDSHGTTDEATAQDKGYFHGLNRRYQVVVRGKFKQVIPMTECLTGFRLDRPAGKLPAKWMVNGALNVVRFFAPQLQTCIDGDRPYTLSPLGSTPQALTVGDTSQSLEVSQEEPTDAAHTLIQQASDAPTSLQRAKLRKKQFDKLFAKQSTAIVTDTDKTYTFEFLQHLFHFQDFCIELGSFLGTVPLAPLLDGQAMQIMSSHQERTLWSFDIWHECLLEDAMKHAKDV